LTNNHVTRRPWVCDGAKFVTSNIQRLVL